MPYSSCKEEEEVEDDDVSVVVVVVSLDVDDTVEADRHCTVVVEVLRMRDGCCKSGVDDVDDDDDDPTKELDDVVVFPTKVETNLDDLERLVVAIGRTSSRSLVVLVVI